MGVIKKGAAVALVAAIGVVGLAFAAFAVTINTGAPPDKVQATEAEAAAGAAWGAFQACTVRGESSMSTQVQVTRGIVDQQVDPSTPWDLAATMDYGAQQISADTHTLTFTNGAGQRVVATLIDGPSVWWWYEADRQVARAEVKTVVEEEEDCSDSLAAFRAALAAAVPASDDES